MEKALEIEYKSSLTKKNYDVLIEYFNVDPKDIIPQVNFYFETKKFLLRKRGFSMRVRERLGIYELCVKTPHKKGTLEHNQIITKEEFLNLRDNGVVSHDYIRKLIGVKVEYKKSLRTDRVSFPYKHGELFLDKSYFDHGIDYDVEFEVTDKKDQIEFKELLMKLNIPINKGKSKSKRALAPLREAMSS